MNFESGKNYSLEDLKERNRPQAPPILIPPTAHPTEQEWRVLTDAAEKITLWEPEAWQTILPALELTNSRLQALREAINELPTREQEEALTREVRQLKAMLQLDGRRVGKSSSARYTAGEMWELTKKLLLVVLIVLVISAALSGLLWALFTVWKTFKTLRP